MQCLTSIHKEWCCEDSHEVHCAGHRRFPELSDDDSDSDEESLDVTGVKQHAEDPGSGLGASLCGNTRDIANHQHLVKQQQHGHPGKAIAAGNNALRVWRFSANWVDFAAASEQQEGTAKLD